MRRKMGLHWKSKQAQRNLVGKSTLAHRSNLLSPTIQMVGTEVIGIKSPIITYFSSGFETGDFSEWTARCGNATPVIDSAVKHDGNYSSRSEDDLFYDRGAEQDMSGFGLPTTYYIHGWVRADTLVFDPTLTGVVGLLGIKAASGGVGGQSGLFFGIRRTTGVPRFGLYDYDLFVYYDIMQFDLATWYLIEMKVLRHATAGTLELYIDSVLKQTVTATRTNYNWLWAGAGMAPAVSKTGLGNYKNWVDTIAVDDP